MQQSSSPAKNGSPSHSQRQLRATSCAVSCITGLSGGVPRWHRSSRTRYVAVHGWPDSASAPSVGAAAGSASGDGNGGGGSPAARARAVSAANTAVFGKQAPFATGRQEPAAPAAEHPSPRAPPAPARSPPRSPGYRGDRAAPASGSPDPPASATAPQDRPRPSAPFVAGTGPDSPSAPSQNPH